MQRLGFPGGSAGKESACNAGDLGSIPELGRYPGEGKGYPLQYSGLENSMDYIVHGVAKSLTRLSTFHSLTHSHSSGGAEQLAPDQSWESEGEGEISTILKPGKEKS